MCEEEQRRSITTSFDSFKPCFLLITLQAMSYKVESLKGVAGILCARRAVAISDVPRRKQKSFYASLESLLQPLDIRPLSLEQARGL